MIPGGRLAWFLQRFVVAPLFVVGAVFLWTFSPFWLIAMAIGARWVPGWLRPVRLLWIGVLHLSLEAVAVVELFLLWIASGFGLFIRRPFFERLHYDLIQNYLIIFFREARRVLRLEIVTEGPTPDAFPGHPVLVFSRHAGPGDSFTLVYALMEWFQREPRIVLKDTLAWDPALGIVLNRLPSRFIRPAPGDRAGVENEIKALASGLDENDAFVIFPEGGNFTPQRRDRAIARLNKLGLHRMAERAARMTTVLAPKPGGVVAALDAAPEADVLLVAHTGLDHVLTMRDAWKSLPMDKKIVMRWWRVPRSEIPAGREEQIDWLFDWWQKIDEWVQVHQPSNEERPRD